MSAKALALYAIAAILPLSILPAETVQYPGNFRRRVRVGTGVVLPGGAKFMGENEEGMHHIFANSKAAQGYASCNFPNGSIIVYELHDAQQRNGVLFEEANGRE